MSLKYKGFIAQVSFAPIPGHYVAEVVHGPDSVSFSATTYQELEQIMSVAVENYLNLVW